MSKYRSRSRIVFDLLRCISNEDGATITRLISAANTTHARIQGQLAHFLEFGLASNNELGNWTLTDKGRDALAELQRIDSAMQDFGLNL